MCYVDELSYVINCNCSQDRERREQIRLEGREKREKLNASQPSDVTKDTDNKLKSRYKYSVNVPYTMAHSRRIYFHISLLHSSEMQTRFVYRDSDDRSSNIAEKPAKTSTGSDDTERRGSADSDSARDQGRLRYRVIKIQ